MTRGAHGCPSLALSRILRRGKAAGSRSPLALLLRGSPCAGSPGRPSPCCPRPSGREAHPCWPPMFRADLRHGYLRRLRRRAGPGDDPRAPVARGMPAAGGDGERRQRSGGPVRRCGQHVLRPRRGPDRRGRQEAAWSSRASTWGSPRRRMERPVSLSHTLLSGKDAAPGDQGPPQDACGPARWLGGDRPGGLLDEPGPAARIGPGRAFAPLRRSTWCGRR